MSTSRFGSQWIGTAAIHEFEIGGRRHADTAAMEGEGVGDDGGLTLADVQRRGPKQFRYEYDFGDGWEHKFEIEGSEPAAAGRHYPRCVARARRRRIAAAFTVATNC
jgi:hypothetical protein